MRRQKNISGCIMASKKQFRLRRALTRTVYEYSCGQDLDTVLCAPAVLFEDPSPELARAEWDTLIDSGILAPLPGYGGQVCRLDPRFRAEMDRRNGAFPPHPVLYGPEVMG